MTTTVTTERRESETIQIVFAVRCGSCEGVTRFTDLHVAHGYAATHQESHLEEAQR